jgi:hypothetical protein
MSNPDDLRIIDVLREENRKLLQIQENLREQVDELEGRRIEATKQALLYRDELQRAKFHTDEFCHDQETDDMELIVYRMWQAITRHDLRNAVIENILKQDHEDKL